jgi:UDP:flavonoid glycosyltransferase YjiC (YdhE family)
MACKKPHILVFPFPAQGHINPILQFSKRLASKGFKITLITVTSVAKSMHIQPNGGASVEIESVSDGFDDAEIAYVVTAHLDRFVATVSQNLINLAGKFVSSGDPPTVLVYDAIMPFCLDVARKLGIKGAAFFTQMGAVSAIYYHYYEGNLKIGDRVGTTTFSMPAMPTIEIGDLPSLIPDRDLYPAFLSLMVNQFSNFQKADWLLLNSFDKLEEEVLNWMANQWPVIKTVGPTVPSFYLDKQLEDDKDYGLNLFHPNAEACMKWLDTKEKSSVVYASFGSLATAGGSQMEELAMALKNSNKNFLWVVRASEESKLPSNFVNETSEKGLVVNWCPQLQVLSHQAVGCFLTHCGWNSTLEALSLGVPMVAMPQWTDQTTNAKYIADVWDAGVRIQANDKGIIITREEIELGIKEVMEGEKGDKLRRNAVRWKELAKRAVDKGGSSDKNIEEFVSELLCR